MRIDLQAQLFQRYPNFFRRPGLRLVRRPEHLRIDAHTPDRFVSLSVAGQAPLAPCLRDDTGPIDQWGIECGDGWFSLIDALAAACEAETKALAAQGVSREEWPRIGQVKEKYGSLRYYVGGLSLLSADLRAQICLAERQSAEICEQCGQPGSMRERTGWIHCACDACEEAIERRSSADLLVNYASRRAELQALLDARAL